MITPWLTWQLVDSAFPTGGFAHSAGLESAWQHGEVVDAADLQRFVASAILQAGYGALPVMNAVYRAPDRFEEMDALTDAFLTNAVANRASRVQGRAWIASSVRIWGTPALAALAGRAAGTPSHVAPLMGASLAVHGVPLESAQRVVLFAAARAPIAAAVRLGLVGSYEAQRIQAAAAPDLDAVLARCAGFDERDLAQTAPIPDLLLAGHDRLYSRLFQS